MVSKIFFSSNVIWGSLGFVSNAKTLNDVDWNTKLLWF